MQQIGSAYVPNQTFPKVLLIHLARLTRTPSRRRVTCVAAVVHRVSFKRRRCHQHLLLVLAISFTANHMYRPTVNSTQVSFLCLSTIDWKFMISIIIRLYVKYLWRIRLKLILLFKSLNPVYAFYVIVANRMQRFC